MALIAVLAGVITFLPDVLRMAIGYHISIRILITILLIMPAGLLMGMPFPIGIRKLHEKNISSLVPWAWAVNGAASVIAPILSILISILGGFSTVLYLCTSCYIAAGIMMILLIRS